MLRLASLVLLVLLCRTCFGQEEFAFSEIKFQGMIGTRAGEATVYCLLGNGFFRTIRSNDGDTIVAEWRSAHPNARAVPVSIMEFMRKTSMVYIWAVDGDDNLNLQLIRNGAFPGSVMLDATQFNQLLQQAMGARAATSASETPPRRLVTDARYQAFLKQLLNDETAAAGQMNGIWSDKFKELRDEEEVLPLSAVPRSIFNTNNK
jgi:hypothetical protein